MTSKQRSEQRARKLELAMFPLITDDRFDAFLDTVKELRDEAVSFAISHDSVKSDRATLSSLGEVRAYTDILGIAENYRMQLEAKAEQQAEEQAQIAAEQAQ